MTGGAGTAGRLLRGRHGWWYSSSVLSSMSVGSAAGLLSSGAIGDDYGRRRTFLAGALLPGLLVAGAANGS